MPNHVENDLYVRGPGEDVAAFLALVGADQTPPKFDFESVFPYPEPFKTRDAEAEAWRTEHGREKAAKMLAEKYGDANDGYNAGGYEWCRNAWGTKWNAYDVARRDYGGTCVTFQTAWCPPIPVIAELHRRFPSLSLSLEYFELGMAICGGVTFRAPSEYDDEPHEPGKPSAKWQGAYRGERGG